ncbi:MAG TPA: hypothetical protein VIG41_13435 [Micrococcaceae bacterium]|jgi:hypothetical protein
MTEQPIQPPDAAELERRRQYRMRTAYRLTVSLVTARNEPDLRRELIQEAADAMPQATYRDLVDVAKMYASVNLMLVEYVRGLGRVAEQHGEDIDARLRATIRTDLLEDL